MADFTRYQKQVIKRYYENEDGIAEQRLAELVSELYLAEGEKKKNRLWQSAGEAMTKLDVPQSRIDHILNTRDPALVAGVVEELQARK